MSVKPIQFDLRLSLMRAVFTTALFLERRSSCRADFLTLVL
jgi:hypothetical protein